MSDTSSTTQQDGQITFQKKIWIAGGIISLIVIFILLFKTLFSLILLILAGILLSVFFYGFAGIIRKYLHLSSTLSIILSVLITILILVAFFWFVGVRLQSQVSQLADNLPQTIQHAKNQITQNALGKKVMQYISSSGDSQKTRTIIMHFFSSSFGIISDIYIILLMSLFFTVSPKVYKKGFVTLLPSKAKDKGAALLEKLKTELEKWIKGQIIGFFFIAILTGFALWILGLPLVLTLALIAGLSNAIPNFGPIIALIPAVLIAFMQGGSMALIVIVVYIGIQTIQSAVMQPLVQQKIVNIPPALIIIGQVAMGSLAGFWGILLATPVILIIKTLVNELYIKKQDT